MQKQQILQQPSSTPGHGVVAMAQHRRGSPAKSNSSEDPAVSSSSASSLPFGSLPSWPQPHLLQHLPQQQQGVDGQLQSHLYLQHALQIAQRTMSQQQQQQKGSPGPSNNVKMQEFMQLQSAAMAAKQPPAQSPSSQAQRVPAFLFGQQNPQRNSTQQFMSPDMMLQARMLAMQQQQKSVESPHLRLSQHAPASESEVAPPSSFPQQEKRPTPSVLPKPENSNSFQIAPRPQAPPVTIQQRPQAPTTGSDTTGIIHLQQQAVKPVGFTRQQLMVLRAQILAFRRLKRGDRSFTSDMIRAITPSPLQSQAAVMPLINQPPSETKAEEKPQRESSAKPDGVLESKSATNQHNSTTTEAIKPLGNVHQESFAAAGPTKSVGTTEEISNESDIARLPGKTPTTATRRYRGPLYDIAGPNTTNVSNVWGPPMSLGYDIRELLIQEGVRIIGRRKAKRLRVIEMLLSNENVPSELKLKLRIEQRKLVLLKMQKSLRNEIEGHQQEIMQMSDRAYRKFVRLCERQRMELTRQVMVLQKTTKEKYLKGIFLWRKKLLESHWSTRDARINRNRGVAKFHERLLREFSKRKDEDRSKRMEALKNNDVDAYREMLIKQQKEIPGDAEQRFQVLQSFLSQTEDYLHKLGGKISAVKSQQEREEAALAAAASARAQGFSEEEVERAAAQASNAVGLRSWNGATTNSVNNRYYSLAHAVNEQILRQPSMLRAGVLRDYQLVGLQWMLSLYNNRLNGILADEMGLGKTVQVMALIAYLMEFKGNYGPHLIIVPNAVIVNWKSELLRWLPSVSSIFYVGAREDRSRIYSQEVSALKFNVLVTTYEFIMRDRSKLAKVDWKYIIIDEAQRMKDRESRLARDLDRFRCQRRLLLTGTPLQNDLHELWSLLNLLLPEVFDNSKAFHDWFSKPFQRDGNNTVEDDWLETEKKVIVIHRLHQILEPFMLRRRVEDVEGSLPPKVPIVLKCKLSAYQAAIYDWVKATGTIRLDPAEEEERVASGNGKRQVRAYAPLQNKCMELRKVCNHPYLNYPPQCRIFNENMVRMCGKLWILDRILIKLQRAGHRVLLFSTMTKLLDILEDYLQWRGLIYRRIDGTTPLDSRETAIVDFNSPGSQCFIFLLSIRAAGRGLNLQTADTVVIYDPDPNPKNEEQAVARAHRIGQKSEVKVIYMEAVVETIPSYQKEDEIRNGGSYDIEDEMAGKDRYMGSIESLVRNNIQQHKIDMADEVINAGRFDQRTTHEERRMTLEALLHDEERYQETVHDVPTLKEVNRMIARSEEEVELFDQMDEECDWPADMYGYDEVPEWLHVGTDEVNGAIKATSKQAMSKGISGISGIVGTKAEEDRLLAKKASSRKNYQVKPLKPAKRGRPPLSQKVSRVVEVEEDEDLEEEVVEEEECSSSGEDEEEGEIRDASEEEEDGRDEQNDVDDVEDMESSGEESMEQPRAPVHLSDTKKFGSLAELGNRSQQELGEDLEEGEIAESHPESPHSETWGNDNEHEDDDQGTNEVEPRSKKRKRSARHRRKLGGGNIVPVQGAYPVGYLQTWSGFAEASGQFTPEVRPEVWGLNTRNPANFIHTGFGNWSSQKQNRSNGFQEQAEEVEVRDTRNTRGGARMQDNVQKKCKAVLSKLQGAMNKDGRQVSALLMELPRHHELPDYYKLIDKPIDAKTIEEHLDRFDYSSVLDFASDVQLMLDNAARYHSHNAEVQADARRLHSLFFQRMGLMFPDVDFNTIKTNIGLRSSGSRSSRKQRHDPPPPPPPPPSKVYDEPGTHHKGNKKGSSKRDKGVAKIDGEVYHPADLVITRRKRNSRRKPRAKVTVVSNKRKRGNILEARDSNTREKGKGGVKSMVDEGGPLSWARARKLFIMSTAAASSTEGGEVGQQPRKKSRTDVGRRRPSGLK